MSCRRWPRMRPDPTTTRKRSARAEAKHELIVGCAMRHFAEEDRVLYRVVLIGNYSTDLELRRDINRWLVSEDPYGTLEFVEWGQRRGEVRADVDLETIVSLVDWLSGAIQDAIVTEELDPGLFHRWRNQPERPRMRAHPFGV